MYLLILAPFNFQNHLFKDQIHVLVYELFSLVNLLNIIKHVQRGAQAEVYTWSTMLLRELNHVKVDTRYLLLSGIGIIILVSAVMIQFQPINNQSALVGQPADSAIVHSWNDSLLQGTAQAWADNAPRPLLRKPWPSDRTTFRASGFFLVSVGLGMFRAPRI